MKAYSLDSSVLPSMARIKVAGGDVSGFAVALDRLRRDKRLPKSFNDHLLTGKLKPLQLRSAVVGYTADGHTVVMVYKPERGTIAVVCVDEHDQAYRTVRAR